MWRAMFCVDGTTRKHLGLFNSQEEAARVWDKAAKEEWGKPIFLLGVRNSNRTCRRGWQHRAFAIASGGQPPVAYFTAANTPATVPVANVQYSRSQTPHVDDCPPPPPYPPPPFSHLEAHLRRRCGQVGQDGRRRGTSKLPSRLMRVDIIRRAPLDAAAAVMAGFLPPWWVRGNGPLAALNLQHPLFPDTP
mmetsp:Transcript_2032/g.7434  ORF Transcript_2032/g.7434 Transcript_2032/m.7434 type:complete len:191 (+) Transcript_2032:155-727(+)